MNTNGNFKIRVKENIGKNSLSEFGTVGDIAEVKNGYLLACDGCAWGYGDFKSLASVNECMINQVNYETIFEEIVEEEKTSELEGTKELRDMIPDLIREVVTREDISKDNRKAHAWNLLQLYWDMEGV